VGLVGLKGLVLVGLKGFIEVVNRGGYIGVINNSVSINRVIVVVQHPFAGGIVVIVYSMTCIVYSIEYIVYSI
jgi:hypothetical protein